MAFGTRACYWDSAIDSAAPVASMFTGLATYYGMPVASQRLDYDHAHEKLWAMFCILCGWLFGFEMKGVLLAECLACSHDGQKTAGVRSRI